ncbi:MAG: hypothetical protein ACP5PX_00575 [Candidatus Hadarchaeum sp.]|uniref:hypothetical protein n=1 Tax=Candidatus Hadarchaeum sp. TaxID=2883567 RepID=UPI003D0CDC10
MRLDKIKYLVIWDKPGIRSEPGRFYRRIKTEGATFIQRSVYGTKTLEKALNLAVLLQRRKVNVLIFQARWINLSPHHQPKR